MSTQWDELDARARLWRGAFEEGSDADADVETRAARWEDYMDKEKQYGEEFFKMITNAMFGDRSSWKTPSSATSGGAAPSAARTDQDAVPSAQSNLEEDDDPVRMSTGRLNREEGTADVRNVAESRKGKGRATTVEDVSDDGNSQTACSIM